jgi:hypothetical protein
MSISDPDTVILRWTARSGSVDRMTADNNVRTGEKSLTGLTRRRFAEGKIIGTGTELGSNRGLGSAAARS